MAIVANSSTSARPRREKWDDTKPLGPWEELAQVLLVSGQSVTCRASGALDSDSRHSLAPLADVPFSHAP
jgi:hypothetical protein